jgi:hypothetical protein
MGRTENTAPSRLLLRPYQLWRIRVYRAVNEWQSSSAIMSKYQHDKDMAVIRYYEYLQFSYPHSISLSFSAKIYTAKSCYAQYQVPIIAVQWLLIQFSRKNNGAKTADDIDLKVQMNDRKSYFWMDSSEVGFAACFRVPPLELSL